MLIPFCKRATGVSISSSPSSEVGLAAAGRLGLLRAHVRVAQGPLPAPKPLPRLMLIKASEAQAVSRPLPSSPVLPPSQRPPSLRVSEPLPAGLGPHDNLALSRARRPSQLVERAALDLSAVGLSSMLGVELTS